MDKEKMEEYFLRILPEELDDGSQFPILLVTIGEKEAALTMNCDEKQEEILKEFCEEAGLAYKVSGGRTSKPSRAVGENQVMDQRGFFIARDSDRFDLLNEGRFYGFSDSSVGRFLEFPDKAIEFFDSEDQPSMISRQKISELGEIDVFGDELRYLNLVTYVPPPEKDEIRKGIELGEKREDALRKFDEKNETDIGKNYIEKRFSRNLYR